MRSFIPSILLILIAVSPAMLQADEYTTMKNMLIDMAGYVEYLEDSLDQEIVHLQADIITDKSMSFTRTLHEGWTYGLAAFADWRVVDLDITVYKDVDGQWVQVQQDEQTDNTPSVIIEPSQTGTYLIELSVYEFAEEYTAAHYGMLIYHELY
ncbi:hypothetical protein AMJ87_03855 [candidate division WOR_3 bacterium SM23_60]|uniref:Uncharacterized protein n=1 Tax=candidate division WOR_3 bacterium SM23_60 TaxID=1703780 RepID=A0A0S8GK83_UNCW3|nr:MAG: hypothetical protein AMJ87_03855 [candidate division WOR_3 bacterium SM23_60]